MSHPISYVAWESPTGTWNLGVYDPRDDQKLSWVSTGHLGYDEAVAAWDGANPGHGPNCYTAAADPDAVAELEVMADVCSNDDHARRRRRRRNSRLWRGVPAVGPYPPPRTPGRR